MLNSEVKFLEQPSFYHRQYENDFGNKDVHEKGFFNQALRVTQVALPFLSLYKPISQPLTIVLGAARTVSCVSQLIEAIKKGERTKIAFAMLQTALTVASLACTIFVHPLGMLISTGHDLMLNIIQLIEAIQKEDYKKALEVGAQILNNCLYLALFFTSAPEILIVSTGVQILLGLYQSHEDFNKGNYLEGIGHLLMAGIRTHQLHSQVMELKMKWELAALLEKIELDKQEKIESTNGIISQKTEENTVLESTPNEAENNIVINQDYADLLNNDNGKELINAINNGNVEAVKSLVESGVDINAVLGLGSEKTCALNSALKYPVILQYLIDSGADIDIKLFMQRTPLHYAAESEHNFESLCILLKNGANVNAIDLYGKTPLHSGVLREKIAFKLLEYGANFNIQDHQGWSPLHRAYTGCNIEILKELSRRGASLNEFTPDGGNALHYACGFGSSYYKTQQLNLLKYLIEEKKMDVNVHSMWPRGGDGGPTAFMWAMRRQEFYEDDFDILNYLISKGADFKAKVFHFNGYHTFILSNSVLLWAKDEATVPLYVINWLIQKVTNL